MSAVKRFCCKPDCTEEPTVAIFGESNIPEDFTDACDAHVGALLGSFPPPAHQNRSWRVVLIEDTGALEEDVA